MEPTEPIRGGQESERSTDRCFARPWRVIGRWLADFVMCWFALCGLVGVAFVLMSFAVPVDAGSFTDTTLTGKVVEIAKDAILSAVGFSYMLQRYHWRYRLSTLLRIAVFWCVVLALLATNSVLALTIIVALVFAYAVIWAGRRKVLRE